MKSKGDFAMYDDDYDNEYGDEEVMLPPLADIAFDERMNAEWLFKLANTAPRNDPRTAAAAEVIFGYAADLVTIQTLPEVVKS